LRGETGHAVAAVARALRRGAYRRFCARLDCRLTRRSVRLWAASQAPNGQYVRVSDPVTLTVTSPDGTALDVRLVGTGPTVVLVHGTGATKQAWAAVEPLLAEQFTVWSYDRRGRAASGDVEPYSFEAEVADLVAVVTDAGSGVHLVGHSFGACCAIEAARELPDLATLVLYEAPFFNERRRPAIDEAGKLFADARDDEAVRVVLGDIAGVSSDELAFLSAVPEIWDLVRATSPTMHRELEALAALQWSPTRYAAVQTPTLYLTGALSDAPVYATTDEVQAALPNVEARVLQGQRHLAMATDPTALASTIVDFIRHKAEQP
jgi:pimeloyl-ACP methyl ester carboxylesterase